MAMTIGSKNSYKNLGRLYVVCLQGFLTFGGAIKEFVRTLKISTRKGVGAQSLAKDSTLGPRPEPGSCLHIKKCISLDTRTFL
jgi:hypothetical protein